MRQLLKKSRSDGLWKAKTPQYASIKKPVLVQKDLEKYQSEKSHYHNYLQGSQKFERKFLLNTFFRIEANERNKKRISSVSKGKTKNLSEKNSDLMNYSKNFRKKSTKNTINPSKNHEEKQNSLRNLMKKREDEDLQVFSKISEAAVCRFSEKLSLYNNYSTSFVIEPEETEAIRGFLKIKAFRMMSWKKKTLPMSAYVRRIKTLYTRDNIEAIREEREENEGLKDMMESRTMEIQKNVISAFKVKNTQEKGDFFLCFYQFFFIFLHFSSFFFNFASEKEAFLKAKRNLMEKEADLRKIIDNFKEKRSRNASEKTLSLLLKENRLKEVIFLLENNKELLDFRDQVFSFDFIIENSMKNS